MHVERLADGLWRWTTSPAGDVPGCPPGLVAASVYLETPEAVVLVDPVAPPPASDDARRFWRALDADLDRLGLPVVVLLTRPRHARFTATLQVRYAEAGVTVWIPAWSAEEPPPLVVRRFEAGEVLPGGVTAHVVPAAGGEAAYELPARAGMVVGDALLRRDDGALQVAPEEEREAVAAALGRLVAARPKRVLPAHGAAVALGGTSALEQALAPPAA